MRATTKFCACLAVVAAVAQVRDARAGGIERNCAGVPESWPIPSGPIAWEVVIPAGGPPTFAVPGYPSREFQIANAIPLAQQAGIQSLIAAASAWNALGTVIQFSTTPSENLVQTWAANDSRNSISFFEPPSHFNPFGGSLVIATCDVQTTTTTSQIIDEFDIAFNAREMGPNARRFSFVELNTALIKNLASLVPGAVSFTEPENNYVDLQGAAVHEFGHALGLGHSLIDSTASPTASRFPTMFDTAQGTPMTQTFSNFNPGSPPPLNIRWPQVTVTPGPNNLRPLLALPARTLELDDQTAIFDIYPTLNDPNTCTIQGTVWASPSVGRRGASVVAIDANNPDTLRASAISYVNGEFTIPRLPPGTYFVYVETGDVGEPSISPNCYQSLATAPEYLAFVPMVNNGCLHPGDRDFMSEFWSGPINESFSEGPGNVSDAAPITLTGGQTAILDIFTESGGGSGRATLSVRSFTGATQPFFSPRGRRLVSAPTGTINQVQFRVAPGPWANGLTPTITLGFTRGGMTLGTSQQQLRQVAAAPPGTSIPCSFTTPLPISNGMATATFDFASTEAFDNVFAQASITSGGFTWFSTVVNVWTQQQ